MMKMNISVDFSEVLKYIEYIKSLIYKAEKEQNQYLVILIRDAIKSLKIFSYTTESDNSLKIKFDVK